MTRRLSVTIALAGFTATLGWAEPVGFDHYQVIIDRAPFGGLPGAAGGGAPQPNFAEGFVFVGVVADAQGRLLAVIQPKSAPRAEYKAEGETIGDVTVVKIEVAGEASKLILQQGLVKATLSYPPRSSVANPPPVAASAQAQPAPAGQATASVTVPPRRRIPFRRGD